MRERHTLVKASFQRRIERKLCPSTQDIFWSRKSNVIGERKMKTFFFLYSSNLITQRQIWYPTLFSLWSIGLVTWRSLVWIPTWLVMFLMLCTSVSNEKPAKGLIWTYFNTQKLTWDSFKQIYCWNGGQPNTGLVCILSWFCVLTKTLVWFATEPHVFWRYQLTLYTSK